MRNWISILLIGFSITTQGYAQSAEADHVALGDLIERSVTAINHHKYEVITPFVDNHFTILTTDSNKTKNLNDLRVYEEKFSKGYLAKLATITINPSDTHTFIVNSIGVAEGTADETYRFENGETQLVKSHWLGIAHKNNNNQWQLLKLHFSASILANPVLEAATMQMYRVGIYCSLIGFGIGILFTWLFRRKP